MSHRHARLIGPALFSLPLLAACSVDSAPLDGDACGGPRTTISEIQGAGAQSALLGREVLVEGLVSANFKRGLETVFLQSVKTDQDADQQTSEGIALAGLPAESAIRSGSRLRIRGEVSEAGAPGRSQTQLRVLSFRECPAERDSSARAVRLDAAPEAPNGWEALEGMLVEIPGPLTVSGNDRLARFGILDLAFGAALRQPTDLHPPGPQAREAIAHNARHLLVLDDARLRQNPDQLWYLGEWPDHSAPLRVGSTVGGLRGVIEQRDGEYRLQALDEIRVVSQAPRPAAPARAAGVLRVASFNVLNFFNGDGKGGGFPTERGAADKNELKRQRDKLLSALVSLDADVFALMELENDGYARSSAIDELTTALANKTRTAWRFAAPASGRPGEDSITVGIIYREDRVEALGTAKVFEGMAEPDRNRLPLAQALRSREGDLRFGVVANHFKSKGGCQDAQGANADQNDGQACWNATRIEAARSLADWLATDPLAVGDSVLLLGDFNAYSEEDPIRLLRSRGYAQLAREHDPQGTSFIWAGQAGSLDHALAGAGIAARVAGVQHWAANAAESPLFDYLTRYKSEAQQRRFRRDAYRASDHDPLVVDLKP